MNSDEDYHPPGATPSGPRRTKRVTRSNKFKSPKRTKEKTPRKCTAKASGTPAKKAGQKKERPSHENDENSNPFSSSPLTAEELEELLKKFKRDGHFRINRQSTSPAPLVVSRITEGNVVTTRIECYKPARNLMRDLTATITSPKANERERSLPDDGGDPRTVVFSNPVSGTPGKKLNVNTTNGTFFSPEDTGKGAKKTINFDQTSPDSSSHWHRTSELANDFPNSTGRSTIQRGNRSMHPKTFSSASNSGPNVPEISCNSSTFSFVDTGASQSSPTRPNHASPSPNSNTLNSTGPINTSVENRQISNTSDLYFTSGNVPQNEYDASVAKRFDSTDSNGDPYGNLNPSSLQTTNDQLNATSFNSENSSFSSSNQTSVGNSSDDWNSASLTSLNTFAADDPLKISSNSANGLSDNLMDFILPTMSACNPGIGITNHCIYATPVNATNAFNVNSSNASGYGIPPFAFLNDASIFPNNFIANSVSPYCDMYGVQNPAGFYDTSGTGIINDQCNQMNAWPQNQRLDAGFFLVNGNVADESTIVPNLLNEHGMNSNNFPVSTNMNNEVTNDQQLIEGLSVIGNYADVQYDAFDPNALSIWPHKDDIKNDGFIDQSLGCDKENSAAAAQDEALVTNFFMSAMNEGRPLYDGGNNCSKFNNESTANSTGSVFYDFDTKKEVAGSSNCFIVARPSRS